MPAFFSVTRLTTLFQDRNGNGIQDAGEPSYDLGELGIFDPGDIVYTRVTLQNTGDAVAAGVSFQDSFTGTSLIAGSVNVSPIAFNDAFTAVGNTVLRVGTAGQAAVGLGGNIGSGPSSFVSGNLLSNDRGSGTVGTGVITGDDFPGLTIDAVANGISAGGGTFNIFADGSFNYVNQAGDTGTDTFTYTIRDGGYDGTVGNADDLTSTGTVTITLTGEVWYVDAAAGVGGTGTSANPFNSMAQLNGVTGDGTTNDDVDGVGDFIYVKGSVTGGGIVLEDGQQLIGQGADLKVSGFNLATATSNSSLTSAVTNGYVVTAAQNNTIAGLNLVGNGTNTGGITDNQVSNFGTLNLNPAALNAATPTYQSTITSTGAALNLSDGTIAGNGFSSTSSSGGVNNVSLTDITGTVALGSGALSAASGTNFFVNGGSGDITFNGTINDDVGQLVGVSNRTGGTVDFNGAITDGNDGDGNGILLNNNDGSTVRFDGGLTLSTGSNSAFSAINGGTVAVTGAGNVITTSTGAALNVQNTFIGLDGLTFVSVNSTGSSANNGINLTNTGTTAGTHGGLTITGTDGADAGTLADSGTGGTISNKTVDAIVLNGTRAVSLNGVTVTNIDGFEASWIDADNVVGLTLNNVNANNSEGHGIDGNVIRNLVINGGKYEGGGTLNGAANFDGFHIFNLLGTSSITNATFERANTRQIYIVNNQATAVNGTADQLTVSGNTFQNHNVSPFHGDHLSVSADTGGNFKLIVDNSAGAGNVFKTAGIAVQATGAGSGKMEANISNITSGGTLASGFNNTAAVAVAGTASSTVKFNVSDNVSLGTGSVGMTFNDFTSGSFSGTISNNNITHIAGPGTDALQILSHGGGNGVGTADGIATIAVLNNTIVGNFQRGIRAQAAFDQTTLNLNITGNVVHGTDPTPTASGGLALRAIEVEAGGSGGGTTDKIFLNLQSNNAWMDNGNAGYRLFHRAGYTFSLEDLTGSGTDVANITNWIDNVKANNTNGGAATTLITGAANNFTSHPSTPAPMFAEAAPPALPQPDADDTADDNTGGLPPIVTEPDGFGGGGTGGQPASPPVVVDDGVLSQSELNLITDAAIQRWALAGATDAQIAALRAVSVTVANLGGLQLGESGLGAITIDDNAAGWNWFIDATPGDDGEYAGGGTQLRATDAYGAAGTRIDLLTVVTHELGHQIGLGDLSAADDRDALMYGTVGAGERRLAGFAEVASASGQAVTGAFAVSPINLGSIEPGRTVTVEFRSTIGAAGEDRLVSRLIGESLVTSGADSWTSNKESLAVDSLTLGNRIFNDANASGFLDGGDGPGAGIANVVLTLFADTNNNGVYDEGVDLHIGFNNLGGGVGYDPGIDTPAAPGTGTALTALTDASGFYSFAGLAPGDYIVRVDAANFAAGQPLAGMTALLGAADPNNNTDNDNNAQNFAGYAAIRAIRLDYGLETVAGPTGTALDTNDTLDAGFTAGNPPAGDDETQTILEDARHNFATGEFHFSDLDSDSFASVVVTTLPGNGDLFLDTDGAGGAAPAAVSAGQEILVEYLDGRFYYVPDANAIGTPHDTFTFQVRDSRAVNNLDLSANTFTFNVMPVNDAPVNAVGAPVSTSEDSVNVVLSDNVNPMSVSDVEATGNISYNLLVEHGTLTIRTDVAGGIQASDIQTGPGVGNGTGALVITATIAEINTTLAAANGLLYTPNIDYYGSDPLQVYANDAGQTGADPNPVSVLDPFVDPDIGPTTEEDVDIRPITVTPVNDAPVLSSPTSATVTFTEGDTSVALLQGVTLSDVDLPGNFAGGSLSLSVTGGAGSGSINLRAGSNFHIQDLGGGAAVIVYQPGGPFTIGSITGYGTPTMAITGLTSEATLARLNDLVDDFVYVIPGENPAAGSRTVTLTFDDGGNVGGGALADDVNQTLNVVAVNDAPVNTAPSVRSGTEDTDLVFSGANVIAVNDADAGTLQVTLAVSNGTLNLSGTAGLSFGAGDGTGDTTMTFSGTIAAINAALNGLVYRGNLNYEGADTLSVSTTDLGATGTGGALTDNDSVAITLVDDGFINGSNGDDVMTGTPNPDFFRLEQGGNDIVTGLASNDVFYFGGALTFADKADGDGGIDQIGLQGDYSGPNALTLGTGVLSIESFAILPGSDTRLGAPGTDFFDYDITTVDQNVAAGVQMVVDANRLRPGEDLTFDGSAETDGSFFIYGSGGVDNLIGGAQNDIFLFGEQGQFGASDVVDGGPGGLDQLGLRGDYTITFGAAQLINIVSFALVSAHDTRFASLGENFDYDLTMDDGNVAAGVQLTVDGANLRATESLTFDGGAELDGTFRVFGGAGSDIIMGGEGADIVVGRGGADLVGGCNGADTFRYDAVSESSAAAADMIMDFEHAIDNIDLRLIDANTLSGGDQAFHSIGSGAFSAAGAASAGELRFEDVGPNWLVEGDVNGDGVADLVIQVTMFGPDTLNASDFQF